VQLAELQEFSRRRGWQIAGEFTDEGVSGSKKSRPGLDRLLAEARAKAFDAIDDAAALKRHNAAKPTTRRTENDGGRKAEGNS
jgi:DNA invertase Pin-like site-specific DNA recombinase